MKIKRIVLKCKCGNTRTITGRTIDEILDNIDISGWHDYPDKNGYNADCPECLKREEEQIRWAKNPHNH